MSDEEKQLSADEAFWKNIQFFKKADFADDKGEVWIDKDHVLMLDSARYRSGIPFNLNSACRNPVQNKEAGGEDDSSHLRGYATDIKAKSSREKFRIVSSLIDVGFTRIGVSEGFIHTDNDPEKSGEVIWTY